VGAGRCATTYIHRYSRDAEPGFKGRGGLMEERIVGQRSVCGRDGNYDGGRRVRYNDSANCRGDGKLQIGLTQMKRRDRVKEN
jgi:hypothetical protein